MIYVGSFCPSLESSSSPASITLKRPIESNDGTVEVEHSSNTKLPGHLRPSGQAEATAFPSGPPPLPELKPDDVTVPEPKLKSASQTHEFARTLLWNFEDIRMLIGILYYFLMDGLRNFYVSYAPRV